MLTTPQGVGTPQKRGAGWFVPTGQVEVLRRTAPGTMALYVPIVSLAQDGRVQAYPIGAKGGGDDMNSQRGCQAGARTPDLAGQCNRAFGCQPNNLSIRGIRWNRKCFRQQPSRFVRLT